MSETICSDILHFLESSGFRKTAKTFRKESGCLTIPKSPLPLLAVMERARRKYNKKAIRHHQGVSIPHTLLSNALETENDQQVEITEEPSAGGNHGHSNSTKKRTKKKQSNRHQELTTEVSRNSIESNSDLVHQKKKIRCNDSMEKKEKTLQKEIKQFKTEQNQIRFKRIDANKWGTVIEDERLKDQSYFNKNGDAFASKAANDLIKVRGKDFRREMQKKKRASWKGQGEIDMGVNSIQFSDDSD